MLRLLAVALALLFVACEAHPPETWDQRQQRRLSEYAGMAATRQFYADVCADQPDRGRCIAVMQWARSMDKMCRGLSNGAATARTRMACMSEIGRTLHTFPFLGGPWCPTHQRFGCGDH